MYIYLIIPVPLANLSTHQKASLPWWESELPQPPSPVTPVASVCYIKSIVPERTPRMPLIGLQRRSCGGWRGKCPLLANSEPRHWLRQISSGVERREKKGRRWQVRPKEQGGTGRAQILRLCSKKENWAAWYWPAFVPEVHCRTLIRTVLPSKVTGAWRDISVVRTTVQFPDPWPDGSQPPAPGEPMASSAPPLTPAFTHIHIYTEYNGNFKIVLKSHTYVQSYQSWQNLVKKKGIFIFY